jgi:hypothetical protein
MMNKKRKALEELLRRKETELKDIEFRRTFHKTWIDELDRAETLCLVEMDRIRKELDELAEVEQGTSYFGRT